MTGYLQKIQAGSLRRPQTRRIHNLMVLLFGGLLLAGCGTTKTYQASSAAGPAKPPGYPIPVYAAGKRIPRTCELIGHLSIGDTQLTLSGGSLKGVMKTLMDTARAKGADVVQLVAIQRPDFESAHYRVEANLLRYSDSWERITISESDFMAYLQQHQKTLDPIEGVWSDSSSEVIGIMKDNTKPGRDFVAFILNPALPSWQKGYKKMDIAHGARPGAYHLNFYRDDFNLSKTSVLLDRNREFNFMIHSADATYEMIFLKIGTVPPPQ